MIKMIFDKTLGIIKRNIFMIIYIIIFIAMCFVIKYNFAEHVKEVDSNVKFFIDSTFNRYWLTNVLKVVTVLGKTVPVVIIICAIAILSFKDKIIKIVLALDFGSIGFVGYVLKKLIARPRPLVALVKIPTSYSFPSGHTFFSFGLYGLILYFVLKSKMNKYLKALLSIIIFILIILISFSRVYLGVHHFTDVMGGLVLGIFFLLFFINTYSYLKEE